MGGPVFPSAASVTDKSADEACMVHVPGTVSLPSLRDCTEQPNQCFSQSTSAQFPTSSAVRVRRSIVRILIVVDGQNWDQHIQMRRMFYLAVSGILRRLGDRLADPYLHLVRIGLRRNTIEVQIEHRLVDTIEVLQIRECDQLILTKSVRLIGRQVPGIVNRLLIECQEST